MKIQRIWRAVWLNLLFALLIVVIIFYALSPFIWTVISSIKPLNELWTPTVQYWPRHPTLENYRDLLKQTPFGLYFRNSTIVATLTTLVSVIVATMAAYSLSRFKGRFSTSFLLFMIFFRMFPTVLMIIPIFLIMKALHLLDTYAALVVAYTTFSIPFCIWMLKGYFDSIPYELEEAARVDGCTRGGALLRIVVPLSAPGIAATAIYTFIGAWNELLFAVMLTHSTHMRTLPVGLKLFIGEYTIEWGMLTAGGVLTSIPVAIGFMFLQRYLVQGLTAGGIKA
ncbi:MAG TPA: carbohydrate ABC transporter permease [Chloroflexi bacterium]|nr:carbohydrate ABC transporter permease [Chloroflexota bacterium]